MNGVTVEEALGACGYTGKKRIPLSTLYSRIQTTKERGTYNAIIRRPPDDVGNQLNPIVLINDDPSNVVSPLTIDATLLSLTSSSSSSNSTSKTTTATRRSSRQVRTARVKRLKVDYKRRFTAAFKEATNLVARKELPPGESIERLCVRLNSEYNLDGLRCLTKSTLYRATKDGLAGTSPKKKRTGTEDYSSLSQNDCSTFASLPEWRGGVKGTRHVSIDRSCNSWNHV